MRWTPAERLVLVARAASSLVGAGVGAALGSRVTYEAPVIATGEISEFNLSYGGAGLGALVGLLAAPVLGGACIFITHVLLFPLLGPPNQSRSAESFALQGLGLLVPAAAAGVWAAFHYLMSPRPDRGLPVFLFVIAFAIVVPYAWALRTHYPGRRVTMGIFKRLFGRGNVLDMLGSENTRIAMSAVQTVSDMMDSEAVRLLTDGIQNHRSANVRAECINMLTHPRYDLDEAAIRAIIGALSDSSRQVRRNAAVAIMRIAGAQRVMMAWHEPIDLEGFKEELERLESSEEDPTIQEDVKKYFELLRGGSLNLFEAVIINDHSEVRRLIKLGANVNEPRENGETPLHWALRHIQCDVDMTRFLIESGANVNAADEDGITPLHWAAAKRRFTEAKLLVDSGAHVNARDPHGYTPLHQVAQVGDVKIGELLIDNGAGVNARSEYGDTALSVAKTMMHEDFVRMLIERGARI